MTRARQAQVSSRSSTRASIRLTRCCRDRWSPATTSSPIRPASPRNGATSMDHWCPSSTDRWSRSSTDHWCRSSTDHWCRSSMARWSRFSTTWSLVNGSTAAIVDQDTASGPGSQPASGGLWPRHDGGRPRSPGRADREDHAAQGVQGGWHLDGVRRRAGDPLRRGTWRARHQHELQRDGHLARDRARDQRRDEHGRHLRRVGGQPGPGAPRLPRGAAQRAERRVDDVGRPRRPGARSATTARRSSASARPAKA